MSIFSPRNFSPHVGQLEATLNLEAVNSIDVRLTGKPGSYLFIMISREEQGAVLPLLQASAVPAEIIAGQSAALIWEADSAETCTIEPDIGNVPLSGSLTVSPDTATIYTITASNQAGSTVKTVTVNVTYPLPTVTMMVDQDAVLSGDPVLLLWSTENADAWTIEPDIGTVSPAGSVTVFPASATTYTITAVGPGGTATASVSVTVTEPEPSAVLTAEPDTVISGQSSLLSWSTGYAETCTLEPEIGAVACAGEMTVTPVQDTAYILTAEGQGGTVTVQAVVTVTPASPISLTITSPLDGDVVLRADVQVSGIVSHADGLETGVIVNGVTALVEGGTFAASHVKLAEGVNRIMVTAVDTDGESSAEEVNITSVPDVRFVELTADTQSGLAPLELRLSLESNFTLSSPVISDSGPGAVEYLPLSEENSWSIRLSEPGIYFFTVDAEDDTGTLYHDQAAVAAMDRVMFDLLLQTKWDGMKSALEGGDVETAVQGFTADGQETFRRIFTAASENLARIAEEMQHIELIDQTNDTAEYRIKRDMLFEGVQETITFYIYFQQEADGIWRIRDF